MFSLAFSVPTLNLSSCSQHTWVMTSLIPLLTFSTNIDCLTFHVFGYCGSLPQGIYCENAAPLEAEGRYFWQPMWQKFLGPFMPVTGINPEAAWGASTRLDREHSWEHSVVLLPSCCPDLLSPIPRAAQVFAIHVLRHQRKMPNLLHIILIIIISHN